MESSDGGDKFIEAGDSNDEQELLKSDDVIVDVFGENDVVDVGGGRFFEYVRMLFFNAEFRVLFKLRSIINGDDGNCVGSVTVVDVANLTYLLENRS